MYRARTRHCRIRSLRLSSEYAIISIRLWEISGLIPVNSFCIAVLPVSVANQSVIVRQPGQFKRSDSKGGTKIFGGAVPHSDCSQITTTPRRLFGRALSIWVKHWVQLKQEKWLRFSCKRHLTRHLGFPTRPLLTDRLEVRILPREPNFLFSFFCLREG